MDNLCELIYLLSCQELDEVDVNSTALAVRASAENEDLDWLDREHDLPIDIERRQTIELEDQLSDWFAVSDKIDELHEQMEEWFADPPLPPFPYDKNFNTPEYFEWLDKLLINRPKGSYELLNMDSGWDDNIHAVVVVRSDVPRILELCDQLNFPVCQTRNMFKF